MSTATEVAKLIELTKKVSPTCTKSKLWKRAARAALRSALEAELSYNRGAREGSSEDEEWLDEEEPTFGETDTQSTLTELLGRPLRGT